MLWKVQKHTIFKCVKWSGLFSYVCLWQLLYTKTYTQQILQSRGLSISALTTSVDEQRLRSILLRDKESRYSSTRSGVIAPWEVWLGDRLGCSLKTEGFSWPSACLQWYANTVTGLQYHLTFSQQLSLKSSPFTWPTRFTYKKLSRSTESEVNFY